MRVVTRTQDMATESDQSGTVEQVSSVRDWGSPITDTFVAAFANDGLIIDCPRIVLTQQAAASPKRVFGRGMISLLDAGAFKLRMYTDDSSRDPFEDLVRQSRIVPGQLFPDDEFYTLEATDLSGTVWNCSDVLVRFDGQNHGVVATAEFSRLGYRVTGLNHDQPSVVSMWFFRELDIPYNRLVTTEVSSGDRFLQKSMAPKFTTHDVGPFTFEVQATTKEKGSVICRLYSKTEAFPTGIEARVEEALRFVTFSPVSWCIVDKFSRGVREVTVVPKQELPKRLLNEPVDDRRPDCVFDYWRLFSAYLGYVMNFEDETRYHPLSAQLYQIISAETRQLNVIGLLLGVAVEGVLNSEFHGLAGPSTEFRAAIDYVGKLIDRIKCREGGLSARLKGALMPMKQARAKDKLKALQDAGAITREMVEAWGKLRNATAHAAIHEKENAVQVLWGQCNTVYTLLNILVFITVGYTGKYQDFSSMGWPIRDFNYRSSNSA